MKRSARTLGFTIAASLGLHGVLLLAATWVMAVFPERPKKRPDSDLISHSDVWRYRKGTSAPPSGWKTLPDESLDATWLEGRGWIGYGAGSAPRPAGTTLSDMRGGYSMVYLRKTFTVSASLPAGDEAVLDIDFDDGFIAWIDGVYVDHEGPAGDPRGEPAWDAPPRVPPHESSFGTAAHDPQPVRSKVLGTLGKMLPPGAHVLSVLLINEAIDSDDAVAKIDLYTRKPVPEDPEAKESDPAAEEEVAVTFVPSEALSPGKTLPRPAEEPPGAKSRPDEKKFVYSDGSQPVLTPMNEETALISGQNMRASSTAAPTPDGDPNRISQDGLDIPLFSLNTRDFSAGSERESPPSTPTPPQPEETPPPPAETAKTETEPSPPPPAERDRPPEPQNTVKTNDPLAPAPAEKPVEKPVDQIPMRDRPPEPLPLAKAPPLKAVKKPRPQDPVAAASKPSTQAKATLSSTKTKSAGKVALRSGESAEDAKDTPEGRYGTLIQERVGSVWNARLAGVTGIAGRGFVEVEFDVDTRGAISGVKLVDPGKASAVLEDVCLTAIIKVKLPPPPEEILRELRDPLSGGKYHVRFTFCKLY